MRRAVLLTLIGFIALGIILAQAAEEVRIYTYMLPIQEDLARILSERTGTQVKSLGLSGGELWARVQAEKPKIGADVLFGFGPAPAILGTREGLWDPSPNAPEWKDIHPRSKEKTGAWWDVGTCSFVLVGNKDLLAKKGLPEVMVAATAVLKPALVGADVAVQAGTGVVGIGRGDLHDIGKNLVCMMLEATGFRVLDLGVDVPAARFVETAREQRADIVALSALLTTTMLGMKAVIEALDEAGLRQHVKVMIGGAPVQQSFGDEIRADGFALNAAAAVTVAQKVKG